ncbi:MAG: hypothetical protein IT442_09885 [Phycisphaeraceae bacterium]|nr:hypothetical protein [Phycisphaeraceae bacterium]
MPAITDLVVPVRRISPSGSDARGEHYFFGYYDVPACDSAGRHLGHRVAFRDRLPGELPGELPGAGVGDVATLGWMRLPDEGGASGVESTFEVFGRTRAWNFQQGSLLQWLASEPDTCVYNVFEEGRFGCCVQNVVTGKRRDLPLPVANVSRDGTKALCVNMSRLYDFRPGYGYVQLPDPFKDVAAPPKDGVFLMEIASGRTRQVVSLAEIAAFLKGCGEDVQGRKLLVNHVTFNPSATRYLMLVRTFPLAEEKKWATYLLTGDASGGGLRDHPVWGSASHYHWRDDDGMLFYTKTGPGDKQDLALISDATGRRELIDPDFFRGDGHCTYSPDGRWILYDSYPQGPPDFARALQVYSLDRRKGLTLGRFRSERSTPRTVDLRCDLHPRWTPGPGSPGSPGSPGNASITFDSIHEGFRGVYWADLRGVMRGVRSA